MLFSTGIFVVVLVANGLAAPVPQIGGEAQFCQNLVDGVSNGVGQGTAAALDNVAGDINQVKGSTRKLRFIRRQATGTAAACYDLVNNVDQGSGYGTGNLLDGLAGDEGAECTDNCSVQNSGRRRQVDDIAGGVQTLSDTVGTGAETSSVTTSASNIADDLTTAQSGVGSTGGTFIATIPADTGALVGNQVGTVIHSRQLNKISAGEQNFANSVGAGGLVAPIVTAENSIDTVGTDGVGDLGAEIGDAAEGTLTSAGQAVP